jgi:acetylornithine deacetylase
VDVLQPLGRLLGGIGQRDAEMRAAPSHPLLSNGSLMATVARAGTAPFMVAGSAEVTVERRTVPGESGTAGLDEVRKLIAGIADDARVTWTTEPVISRSAWQADDSGAAAELMSLLDETLPASGAKPPARTGAPYWMESALWQQAGVPTVVCGPAGGGLHAVDEWVDVAQLQQFPVAVADAVGRFLGAT